MDAESFYAQRSTQMESADEHLLPYVEDALDAYARGEADWYRDLVTAAAGVWMDTFAAEAPDQKKGLALARFRKDLSESLALTNEPSDPPTPGEVNRVLYWLTAYTINNATHAALLSRGVRFQRWVTRRDGEVRDIHKPLDGQIRPVGGTFAVAGVPVHYPGEPVGPPEVWINCRCMLQPAARKGDTMSTTTFTVPAGVVDELELDNPDIITSDDIYMVQRDWEGGTDYYGPFSKVDAEQFSAGDGEYGVIPLLSGFAAATPPTPDDMPGDVDTEPDPADPNEDDEDPDAEKITELPVHGVIAPEGVTTGDNRQFAFGALSTRELPIPLRAEILSTHGGTTSDVVTIGRVDSAWRDEATNSWRYTGAVVLDKPYAQDTIAGIIDGTIRGVSLDGDAAVEDTSARDELMAQIEGQEGGPTPEQLVELMNLPQVFSAMRVAGLTIVPIPAFEEAYIALGHEFMEDLSAEEQAALAACGCATAGEAGLAGFTEDDFKDYPAEDRKRMAKAGTALPDGSFPIADVDDLKNAIQSIGRASDPAKAKAHIKKRAAALGHSELVPDDWAVATTAFAPGTHDGPGWITDPIPTARIRRYWVHGKGAAKIGWGVPGDFNRCRSQLAKYVQNPDWLAGLCANMHKEALGFWPAQHRPGHRGHAADGLTAGVLTASGALTYPSEWFQNPGLDHAAPMRIDGQRIYGYLAQFGVCHIGITGICRDVPRSRSNYSYFLKGVVDTEAGEQRVGTLTYGIGHASPQLRAAAATAHYDQTEAVRAFVNIGEDAHGIWFAGVLAPWTTDEDVAAMRAIGALSGDWRNWSGLPDDFELVGAVAVNTPGFQLAASGAIGLGYIPSEESVAPVLASATLKSAMDPEMVGAIARTAVAEYRHQEKVEASIAPHRDRIRTARIHAARARLEKVE